MRRTVRTILALTLIGAPSLLQAQGGGLSVWSLRGTLPDTVQKAARGMLSTIDIRMTMATDGQRVSMLIAPGPEMIASNLTTDLSTVRLQSVVSSSDDSIHVGVVLPPDIAAMMGGGIGFRMDMAIPATLAEGMGMDSMFAALASDSVKEAMPEFQNTGRSETVAGLSCEVWTISGFGDDTADSLALEMCLAPQPPALKALSDAMQTRMKPLLSMLEKFGGDKVNPFGKKGMMPIRVRMLGDGDFTLELLSVSNDPPAASFFELPAGLEPFPMDMLQGLTGTAGQSTGT